MRFIWETHGRDPGPSLQEGAFEELAAEVTGLDLAEFFRHNVRGTIDPPVGILLAQFGIRLHMRCADGHADAGGSPSQRSGPPVPWLGIRCRVVNGRTRVTHVLDGGPAQAAGIAADDEIVAVRGVRVELDGLEAQLERLNSGQPADIHLFRRDELLQVTVVPAPPPKDTCYLTLDDQASGPALARRRQWLSAPQG
jgi:predicted metalloprotease with PDZ domain